MLDLESFWAWARKCLKLPGQTIDFDQMYGAQCTDLIKYYLVDYHHGIGPFVFGGSAKMGIQNKTFLAELVSQFVWVSNKANNYPSAGDIVFWDQYKGNPHGHAAIAMDGCNKYKLYVLEQNGHSGSGSGTGKDVIRKYTYDYIKPGPIAGWFHHVS